MATPPDNHAEHTVALQRCITPLVEALEARRWVDVIAIAAAIQRETAAVIDIAISQQNAAATGERNAIDSR